MRYQLPPIRLTLFLLVASIVFRPTTAHAQTAADTPIPRLGEHTFVPATAIAEPFITTHIQTTVGVGFSVNSTIPVIDPDTGDILGSVPADLMMAGLGFLYQHAVQDWLAVGLSLRTAGRIGMSTTSLLAEGITGGIGYNVGWKIRILRSEKFTLSGSVGLGNQNANFINVSDWLDSIQDGEDASLVSATQSVRGGGGFQAGWGISRRFGLLGAITLVYGESFDGQGTNEWLGDYRAALSYDMEYDLRIPLGLVLAGGYYENEYIGDQNGVWFWSSRLAAQSDGDFSLGLDFTMSYYHSFYQGVGTQAAQISVDMRYFY